LLANRASVVSEVTDVSWSQCLLCNASKYMLAAPC